MSTVKHSLSIRARRTILALLLLVPQNVRTFLAKSSLLTRIFEYFDDAKYLGPIAPAENPEHETERSPRHQIADFQYKPLISILTPVYNVDPQWLNRAIASISAQWYENWEWCIVDDHSTNASTIALLKSLRDKRIRVSFLPENRNISAASDEALAMAGGDYIALMDHDDELTPGALYEVVRTINETGADFIYSDEDKLELDGSRSDHHFKPDFSPDMFFSMNYLSHLGVIRRQLAVESGGFGRGLDGAQDYDLYLRVLERTNRIAHIPKVLYHWRKLPSSTAAVVDAKSYAWKAGAEALRRAIKRRNLAAQVTEGKTPGTYRVQYHIDRSPLVSIIIPFKDEPALLRMCLESILEKSTYQNFEILGITNNSEDEETFSEMRRFESLDHRIRFLEHNVPFNYSEINNFAAMKHARGQQIVLLNNDIEIISPDWLECLLEFSQRQDVGAVGGKLYYPDDRIQHAGIVIGIGGVAGHSHKYFDRSAYGYFSRPNIVQNVSAVTAACLMVKKSVFEEVGGLDQENLKVAFNDVDFCLRIREKNYLNVFTPYCEAYHYESHTRGYEDSPEKQTRFEREVQFMLRRHAGILKNGDPYYNRNLTLEHEGFQLAVS
jgi:glycosyltransferase involved in cell wall biosynthesis